MNDRNAQTGFTIIELMVVVAVLAIVATVAVPSFQQVIENNRLATESNRLVSTMSFARSEAVRVGDDVSLSAKSSDFNNGWCVHLGTACDSNAGNEILRQFEGGQVDYTAAANTLTFNARGEMTNTSFKVSIDPDNCATGAVDKRRTISVSLSGRASIQKGNCP